MPKRIGFNAATINVRKPWQKDKLASAADTNFDLLKLFSQYSTETKAAGLVRMQDLATSPKAKLLEHRVFQIRKVTADYPGRIIHISIEAGEYGASSRIINTTDGKTSHTKTKSESDMLPSSVHLYLPNSSTVGVLLFQRIGQHGIKSQFIKHFRNWLTEKHELTADINTITSREALKRALEIGTLEEVRIKSYKHDKDNRRMMMQTKLGGSHLEKGARVEVVFRDRTGFKRLASRIQHHLKSKSTTSPLVEVYGMSEPEEVTVAVKVEARKQRFNITKINTSHITYDITSDVEYDPATSYPTFDSVCAIGTLSAKSLFEQVIG